MAISNLSKRGTNLKRLCDRQRAFIHEYTVDYNATRAARIVGYKNPAAMGKKLTDGKSFPKVARAIGKIQKTNIDRSTLDREQIVNELSSLAMRDVLDLCDDEGILQTDLRKIPAALRRCIDGLEIFQYLDEDGKVTSQKIKLKLVAKMQAIRSLMEHFGMFAPQQHEVKHTVDWDSLYSGKEVPDDLEAIEGEIAEAGE